MIFMLGEKKLVDLGINPVGTLVMAVEQCLIVCRAGRHAWDRKDARNMLLLLMGVICEFKDQDGFRHYRLDAWMIDNPRHQLTSAIESMRYEEEARIRERQLEWASKRGGPKKWKGDPKKRPLTGRWY
jgi:hypothetical protein